jgi:hypothetical protein
MNKSNILVVAAIAFAHVNCEHIETPQEREQREWEAPCHDEAVLAATTAGSPNGFKCGNKHHRMHVQVATTPSREEVGAIIFCECERGDSLDAATATEAGSQ